MKVSVVIPVYNSEKYLKRCIDSILNQDYKDFEIVLVNDGSKDNSLDILKEYEKNNKSIKIIDQKNSGPAVARNNGVDSAKGEYIMFIDSDDYVDSNYISEYVSVIDNSNYDVVMGGYKKIIGDKVDFIRQLKDKPFASYVIPAPYSKIYRKSFLIKNNIEFLDTKSSEDVFFNMCVIYKKANIKCIPNIGYYYYFNSESISNTMHKGFNEKVDVLELLDAINYNDIENKELHQYFIIRYIVWYLLYSGKGATKEKFILNYKRYFDWLSNNVGNYKKNKYLKIFGPPGEVSKIGFIIYVFMLFHKLNVVNVFASLYCKGVELNEKDK